MPTADDILGIYRKQDGEYNAGNDEGKPMDMVEEKFGSKQVFGTSETGLVFVSGFRRMVSRCNLLLHQLLPADRDAAGV